ncbi:MAG: acetolactate synthase [Phycisphaeraceae bacterium]|nr:acetolactate synthase [Phycisphaeraceae bacterium]
MGATSVRDQTERRYQEPLSAQFSVFLDNRVGKLLELISLFDRNELPVVALNVIDATDHAVIRLVTTDAGATRRLLAERRIAFSESDVIIVSLSRSQGLADLCRCLLAAELSIHYAYPLMTRPYGAAAIAVHVEDQALASEVLRRKQFRVLGEGELLDP